MINYFEIDEKKKTVRSLNLDDFSIEELDKYLEELKLEMERVNLEKEKKNEFKKNAENVFK
tara:strand:+ start:355 stop:537 length:183 start_codon:yes stop_codon:yes gene_type:complete